MHLSTLYFAEKLKKGQQFSCPGDVFKQEDEKAFWKTSNIKRLREIRQAKIFAEIIKQRRPVFRGGFKDRRNQMFPTW